MTPLCNLLATAQRRVGSQATVLAIAPGGQHGQRFVITQHADSGRHLWVQSATNNEQWIYMGITAREGAET